MKSKFKKTASVLVALTMVLQLFPVLPHAAAAASAEMEGTSKEVLDTLRIPSDSVGLGEDGANPYSENKNAVVNMFPRMELMLRDNVNDDIYSNQDRRNRQTVYNYDRNKNGMIWNNLESTVNTEKLNLSSQSVGIEIDFNGKKDHVARICLNSDGKYYLQIEDAKGKVLSRALYSDDVSSYGQGYNQLAALGITAGDYDGDGSDEVAVCFRASGDQNIKVVEIGNKGTIGSVITTITQSDYAVTSKTSKDISVLPQVHLTSGDLDNDNRDELVITASYKAHYYANVSDVVPKTTIWSCQKGKTGLSQKATFNHAWDYKKYNSQDTSGNTQFGAYGSAAIGDIDGDGQNELVMACYDVNTDHYNGDANLNQQKALISTAKYSGGSYVAYAGGVGQSVDTHSDLADGMWDQDDQQPIALACFNPTGSGAKDLIFVAGMVYEFKVDSADAQYNGITTSSGHEANRYGYKQILKIGSIFNRNDECYFGDKKDDTTNIWIGTVVVGNFINDENGGEQLVFEHGRKRDDSHGEYRHDLVLVHNDGSGGLTSDYTCINNDTSTLYNRNLDFAAIDNDDDGMRMRFKDKAAYFSDPNVVAVLQAAPYFSDLEQMESDYVEDGETVFGQTQGSGSTDTNGFSVTASLISGFKQETSFLGLARLGGGEWEVEAHGSMGGEWENASEVSYSTEYTSDSRDDRVVLSMTPYIRYVYEMFVPAYKVPTNEQYLDQCSKLTGDELAQYEKEVQLARDKGYSWGGTVPATTTDYIICLPKTPRMSMVELSIYDKMAEENGFEKLKGKVLTETVGSPATYPTNSSGLVGFDGGKDIVGEEAGVGTDNFIWVSKGGGTVTQGIEKTESDSKSITWGAGISTTIQSDIGGVIIGSSLGADYTGSHAWTNYASTTCSGTVAGLPRGAENLGYDFQWRFGQWKSKINGQDCIVLGYLVKEVDSPPNAPKNLTVKDTTDTTVTLNWTHPSSMGERYEIYLMTSNPSSPYYRLAQLSNTATEYVVEGLSPNTSYDFVMRSIGDAQVSAYTTPVTCHTRYSDDANVPKTETLPDLHVVAGSNPLFEVKATPGKGGNELTYQWQRFETEGGVSSWKDIFGATSDKLSLSNAGKEMDGTQYRCTVAQFIGGDVAYVYTNAATLYVGAGSTETTLSIDQPYGTAPGTYQIPTTSTVQVEKNVTVTVGEHKYSLAKDDRDGYLLALSSDANVQYAYLASVSGTEKLNTAINEKKSDVPLLAEDVVALSSVYEFADESSTSTGILTNVTFTTESGTITVGGETITYSKKYTAGDKTIYEVVTTVGEAGHEKEESTYYYTDSTTTPPVKVNSKFMGYTDGNNSYLFANKQDVRVTVEEQQTTYTAKAVAGTPVNLTATIESLSSGVVVTPNGSVEFVMTNTATGAQIKKRAALQKASGTDTNSVQYSWTPEVSGTYTITARYMESVELMTSVSNEARYVAYEINSNAKEQTEKSILLNGNDSILIDETLEMQPVLRKVTVTDNGDKITGIDPTDTALAADEVEYTVTLLYGASAVGKYTLEGNKFKPTDSGTYVITAKYTYTDDNQLEKTLSVSKTINVKAADAQVQQPIYFAYSALTIYSTDTDKNNPLTNPNATEVTFNSSVPSVAEVNASGKVTPISAGTTIIKAESKMAGTEAVSATYVLTVKKTPVTVTAPSVTVEYGVTDADVIAKAKEKQPTISGGLDLSDITTDEISYRTGYSCGSTIGNYTLTIDTIESAKYDVTTEPGTVTVKQKELSAGDFDITAYDKTYDGKTDVLLNASVKEDLKVKGDQVTADVTGSFIDETAGTNKAVSYTIKSLGGTNGSNYKLGSNVDGEVKANIKQMEVTFVVGATTFAYDGNEKGLNVSAFDSMGRVFKDYIVEYYDPADAKLKALPVNAGDYKAKFISNDDINYSVKNGETAMSIKQASQEQISMIGLPGTIEYTDTFPLEVIGGSGNGEISWECDSEDVTVTADQTDSRKATVEINGHVNQQVKITAVKASDGNYGETRTTVSFSPAAKTLSFVISDLIQPYDGAGKPVTVTPQTETDEYTVTYNGEEQIPINAGTYTVQVTGTGNYRGSSAATLVISKGTLKDKKLNVTLGNWTYKDNASHAPDYTTAPEGTEAEITYSTPDGNQPINSGTYTVYAAYTGANYEPYTAKSEFTIEKRTLTVTANNASKQYGEVNPQFELSYAGFADNEDESILITAPTVQTTATDSSQVTSGGYPITVKGGRAENYQLHHNNGVLTIHPASGGNFYISGANNTAAVGDVLTLHAYYNSLMPAVTWQSSDNNVATIDVSGKVTAVAAGSTTITATISDGNYASQTAAFTLAVSKKNVTLTPQNLVLAYNGTTRGVNFISDTASFQPVTEGENKNVEVTYTLNTDSQIKEPRNTGTYTVVYTILGGSYTGSGTAQLNINKATVAIKASNAEKIYGEENPAYTLSGLIGEDANNPEYIAKVRDMFHIASGADAAGTKANAGKYPITVSLKDGKTLNDDRNYNFVIAQQPGSLTVKPKALTIQVDDAVRTYGEANVNPIYRYGGFVNEETEENLEKKPVFTYENITENTDAGVYPNVITASGAVSNNYTINYVYANQASAAALTVTKAAVTASAGTAESSYLTVQFDKAVPGLTKQGFGITLDGAPVEITDVSADSTNKNYTLKGSFQNGKTYSIAITLGNNYDLTGSPVSATPKESGGGGGSSGGGSGSVTTTYTVTFETNGGNKIDSVKVIENNTIAKPEAPTKDGYTFDGWYSDSKLTVPFDFDEKIIKNTTLYAKWTEKATEPDWNNPFTDVNASNWFYNAVKFVNQNKLMNGTTADTFNPDEETARAMLVTVLYRMENEPTIDLSSFEDVKDDDYFAKAVAWAKANNIVSGATDTQFAPNDKITREQVAAIMFRYAKYKGNGPVGAWAIRMDYTDLAEISDYASEAVMFCTMKNIMSGKGNNTFAPKDNATRAEIAAILQRYMENITK